MNIQQDNETQGSPLLPREEASLRQRRKPRGRTMLLVRNALNIIFMATAAVGLYFFLKADRQTGTIIILGAMVFKIAEAALRLQTRLPKDK